MEAIFPISALQRSQSEVKAAANNDVVRITENGRGAYVFCSEKVFEEKMQQAAEKALYEAQLRSVVERGEDDIAHGRVYSFDDAWKEIERRAKRNG